MKITKYDEKENLVWQRKTFGNYNTTNKTPPPQKKLF